MPRIATLACLSVLVLAGCHHPTTTTTLGTPPAPILSTRPPTMVAPTPRAPTPRELAPVPLPHTAGVRPSDIQVPGGIKKSKWKAIVVHHSGARQATPQGMDSYHKNVRKWANGLGYHFVIGNGVKYPDGQLYVGPRWKQQATGAHCAATAGRYLGLWRPDNYFNEHGIGICLIGDFETDRPTPRQLQTLTELIAILTREAGVSEDNIWGHGEVTHRTACPGRHLDMPALRRSVATRLARPRATALIQPPAGQPSLRRERTRHPDACVFAQAPRGRLVVKAAPRRARDRREPG